MPFGITPAYLGAFHSTQNLKVWYIKWNGLLRFGPTGIFGTSFESGCPFPFDKITALLNPALRTTRGGLGRVLSFHWARGIPKISLRGKRKNWLGWGKKRGEREKCGREEKGREHRPFPSLTNPLTFTLPSIPYPFMLGTRGFLSHATGRFGPRAAKPRE